MRELTFVVEPGIGPGELPRHGSLAELVLALPYLVTEEIPPRRVLNDVLRRGILDAGMSGGCIWEPFEVDDAEYQKLVQELQRRGTRPVLGRDPGGRPFAVPDTPDSVRTYAQWVDYLYERRLGHLPSSGTAETNGPAGYDEWLDWLPVADLYLGYIQAVDGDWRVLGNDAFDLPSELTTKLRELAELLDRWLYERARLQRSEYQQWLGEWGSQAEQVREDIRSCVDRLGLPRWPYERFSVRAS
jgi:hypothetical protein